MGEHYENQEERRRAAMDEISRAAERQQAAMDEISRVAKDPAVPLITTEMRRERMAELERLAKPPAVVAAELKRLGVLTGGVPRMAEYISTDPADPGVKFDAGKPRWGLLPWRQLQDVVKVLTLGAKKYPSANNWQKVDDAECRYLDALMRHVHAWVIGEKLDCESGLPHLAHAVCNVLFLMWFDDHKKESD